MQQENKILFTLLKKEIVSAMKHSYPGINPDIAAWKGQEITDFQEELLIKVNGRLSEKWFYSHIKSSSQSLPRIDVLNMLSKFAGYSNWDDFKYKNSENSVLPTKSAKPDKVFILIPLILLVVTVVLFLIYRMIDTQNYRFTFVDADTGDPILNGNIHVDLFLKDESPMSYSCDKDGSFAIRTDQSKIRMVVKSPYYLADTVERVVKKFNRNEQIGLRMDSYAMMIRYFSQTDLKAWQKRREQLNRMFGENAMIYQLPDTKEGNGMEIYNKKEFIDKLTMPATSLRQIEILETRYDSGQIVLLRFKVNMKKK